MTGDRQREVRVSRRERDVMVALGEHLTNAEIADRLFISVRTVESHVSSLLRKYAVTDRRALTAIAAAAAAPADQVGVPVELTSFVGRERERAELASALLACRLVTAVGPGGVGKTRLAQAVARDLAGTFADGVCYVDLVPVGEDAAVAGAVAAAAGLAEQAGRTVVDAVLGWAGSRRVLLVLDNCEQVVDGVAVLVERLLARAGGLHVLATSRTPLRLPFEKVYVVPGLSLTEGPPGAIGGDAVALFVERAAYAGATVTAADGDRIARICDVLDGVPLAVELAAARLPATGLDGLVAGLAEQLTLLTGSGRADERHRSLRSTLDWSHGLLGEPARAVLRRVSVFAGPITVDSATAVAAGGAVAPRDVLTLLADLADWNLLTPVAVDGETRYRVQETVRQYGAELLAGAGEADEHRARHLRWALAEGRSLLAGVTDVPQRWAGVAAELRAALGWADDRSERSEPSAEHRDAGAAAAVLAVLCRRHGLLGEAQRTFEWAARLADDADEATQLLRAAAGSAAARLAGEEALRLHRAAAEAALRAGRDDRAACELAQAAEAVWRYAGAFAEPPDPRTAPALLAEARQLAGDDLLAIARVAIAEAFATPDADPNAQPVAEHAVALARRCGDPLAESAALDRLTTIRLAAGDVAEALANATRRTELLADRGLDSDTSLEVSDAHVMAVETAIAAGDLATARRMAERLRDLPSHRDLGHVAVARLILVTALTGEWDETVHYADQFRAGWELAGHPTIPTLRRAAHVAATVHGLRGDDDERSRWLRTVEALGRDRDGAEDHHPRALFDALLFLHTGHPERAARRLDTDPADLRRWYSAIWRPWYAAVRAEAAVLCGHPEATRRLADATRWVAGNPIATALLDRAVAVAAADRDGIRATADRLTDCRYQWARTLLLAGDPAGDGAMAALGATGAAVRGG